MFDESDEVLVRVRAIALALPGAQEKVSVGHPTFYTRKVFAWYGMSHKVSGEWTANPQSVAVLLPEAERASLLDDPRVFVPGYIGPYGWLGLILDDDTDWAEIGELIEESFRGTAPRKLVAQLDA